MITLLFLAGALFQGPASQAKLHPAQAVIYAETPDVGSLLDGYAQAPTVAMIRSEEVTAAVGELLDTVEFDLDELAGMIADQLGVPAQMIKSPGQTLGYGLRQVSGASISASLLESDAGELEATIEKVVACTQGLAALTDELYLFAAEHEELFPTTLADLEAGTSINDPWGQPYVYTLDADGTGFELSSLGADGQLGGTGAATDFASDSPLVDALKDEFLQRIGSTAVVEFTSEEVAAASHGFVVGMAEKAGLWTTTGPYTPAPESNVDLAWFEIPAYRELPLWVLRSGSHLAVGAGSSDPQSFLLRLSGEGATAADAAPYRELQARLGGSAGVPVTQGFVALTDIAHIVFELDELKELNAEVFSSLFSSSWRMGLDGDRFITEVHSAPPGPDNLLAQSLGCEPVPASLWNYIPPESIAVFATTIDGPILYGMLLEAMGSDPGSRHVPSMVRELEERHGFSLERDLFASLGSGVGFYLLPIGSLMGMPGMVVVLELDDAEAFQNGLEGLLTLLQEEVGADFEIKYKPYRDAPLWYFSFGNTGGAPIPISPSLAVIDDHLLVTLTSMRAKKEIKRILAGPAEPHPLLSSAGAPPQDAVAVRYMDWATLFEGAYEGGRALLAFVGGSLELPFDVTALPEGSTFTQFYRPTIGWSRRSEDGEYARTESSFGPEAALGLAALGGSAFLGVQAVTEGRFELQATEEIESEQTPGPAETPPEAVTDETLCFLSTRLAVFKLEAGRYPADLSQLVTPTGNYPRGFLDGGEVPTDGWGRAFSYDVSKDATTYRLWSHGSDGIDQQGEGDDLVEG